MNTSAAASRLSSDFENYFPEYISENYPEATSVTVTARPEGDLVAVTAEIQHGPYADGEIPRWNRLPEYITQDWSDREGEPISACDTTTEDDGTTVTVKFTVEHA